MDLYTELKLDTIKNEIISNKCKMIIDNDGINIISPKNIYLMISKKKTNILNDEKISYFLDSTLFVEYGFSNFIREWTNIENMKDYIIKECLPKLKYIGGYETIEKKEVQNEIETILKNKNVNFIYDEKKQFTIEKYFPSGRKVKGIISPHPLYYFEKEKRIFGIYLYDSYIKLLELTKNLEQIVEFPWYSFCPIYKEGKEYVETTINNFLEFIDIYKVKE